jgi:hypothetical protein
MKIEGKQYHYLLPQNLPLPSQLHLPDRGRRVDVRRRFAERLCNLCRQRQYEDVSPQHAVTFETPTKIPSIFSALWVATHELQHVLSAKRRALQQEERVITTVMLQYNVCPDCGRVHVSGGRTTVTHLHQPPAQQEGAVVDFLA